MQSHNGIVGLAMIYI